MKTVFTFYNYKSNEVLSPSCLEKMAKDLVGMSLSCEDYGRGIITSAVLDENGILVAIDFS